jgi:protease-4
MLLFGCVGTAIVAVVRSGDGKLVGGHKIAVIPLQGVISGSSSGQPGAVSPEKYRELLQRARDDEAVKAVVLRVDSPGGTVAASEEIATYVKELRKSRKPVVVSVGDVDASGAYMISSQATKIVANPGSAVGSIGVILEVVNAARLMDKVGLEFKVITAGKYKDAGSPYRAVTPEETAMLQSQIDEIYKQFIDIVADGRGMPRSKVESLATGWAWSGTEAKKLGLVDEIGTYQDALDLAAEIAKIDDYEVETYEENDFGDLIGLLAGVESFMRSFSASPMGNPTSSQNPALAR